MVMVLLVHYNGTTRAAIFLSDVYYTYATGPSQIRGCELIFHPRILMSQYFFSDTCLFYFYHNYYATECLS